jgi:hypothetical protein
VPGVLVGAAPGGWANRTVPVRISTSMMTSGMLNSRWMLPPWLAAPAMASMVSVWMMPSMVAKPGLRIGTRRNTPQLIRRRLAARGSARPGRTPAAAGAAGQRLLGGTVSCSGS